MPDPIEPVVEAPPTGDVIVIEQPVAPPEPPAPKNSGRTFTAEDIERARQEEKDKLYGRLNKAEQTISEIEAERQAERERIAEEQRQRDEETRRAAEEEMSLRDLLTTKEQEWTSRFTQLEQQREADRQLFEKEREFQALQQYRQQRMAEEAENIMPELLDLVTGNTPEEIESSIALVRAKTDAILEQVAVATQQQQQLPVQQQRAASVTQPPVGPMDNETNYQTLTAEDLAAMDIKTYAQHRDRIMQALQNRTRDKGLYG